MDYKEASHRLRITATLLKWFTSYSPKNDKRKLQQQTPGNFDSTELDNFDNYLRSEWPSKNVPVGIEVELFVEACGQCGLCRNPCEKLQMAHIFRKGIEVNYYYQHPNNLIPLCGTCHDRYDDENLKSVSHQVILASKEQLISRKMESIDRDVERAKAVREVVDGMKADLANNLFVSTGTMPTNQNLWSIGGVNLFIAATKSVFGELVGGQFAGGLTADLALPPSTLLATLSGSIGTISNITQAVLDGYAEEATGQKSEAPSEWEMIEYNDDRTICDLCDPGEDHPPAFVNYTPLDEAGLSVVDIGYCDWCNGISIRCHNCNIARGVSEYEYDTILECEGGCGLQFIVKSDYDPRNDSGEYVEIVSDKMPDEVPSE